MSKTTKPNNWVFEDTGTTIDLNKSSSGNAIPGQTLKRIMIKYKETEITLAINPSDYTQKYPNRSTITQTKGGAWIDAWGRGIVEINIKGVTGVKAKHSQTNKFTADAGYLRWKELKEMFNNVYNAVKDGETIPRDDLVCLCNYTDNEYWYCYPMPQGIELYRSKSKPHMYQYTINLWGIAEIGTPEEEVGTIGNPKFEKATSSNLVQADSGMVSENSLDSEELNIPPGELSSADEMHIDTYSTQTQQIIKSNTYTAQGGTAYITKTAPINSEADITINTSTKTKSTYDIKEHSEMLAKQLAPIIGGVAGLLVPSTAYQVAKNLNITELGTVLNISEFTKENLIRTGSSLFLKSTRLLEEIRFIPLVSPECYKLQQKILAYSSEILTPEYSNPIGSTPIERIKQTIAFNRYFGSTLYNYMKQYKEKYYLIGADINYLSAILLETMTLYHQLYQIINSKGKISTSYTISNIGVLIENIQAMILYLQFNNDEGTLFYIRNIMWELRKIESILHQIRKYVLDYL